MACTHLLTSSTFAGGGELTTLPSRMAPSNVDHWPAATATRRIADHCAKPRPRKGSAATQLKNTAHLATERAAEPLATTLRQAAGPAEPAKRAT